MAGQVQEEILQIWGAYLHAGERHPQCEQLWQQGGHIGTGQLHLIPVALQRMPQAREGRVIHQPHQYAVKVLGQQGRRCIQAEQVAVIDDGDAIAQLLRLVHVVGGEHHRLALGLDGLDPLPEVVARLGIQPRGGFIQKQQLGIAEQGQRQQQPLTLSAGELAAVSVDKLAEGAQLDEQLPRQGVGVEAGEQAQGVPYRQKILQRRVLKLDADARAVIGATGGAMKQDLATVRGEDPLQQLYGGGLARPVRTEQAKTAAGGDGKAEPVHRLHAGEVLDKVNDFEDGRHDLSPGS